MADKIIVAPHQITDYDLDFQEVGHNGAEEYVRKDALLGWLKEERKKCESHDVELWQRINTLTDVIDKLKSM